MGNCYDIDYGGLKGFKLLSEQVFHAPGHCDLNLWPTDPNINMDHLWAMFIHDTKNDFPKWNQFEINERTILC